MKLKSKSARNLRRITLPEAEFVKVAQLSEIPSGDMVPVKINNDEILLANIDGEIFACDDICSHSYASLCEGDIDGAEIQCPLHGAIFNVMTGEAITPPAVVALRVFEVRVEGNDILVGPAKA